MLRQAVLTRAVLTLPCGCTWVNGLPTNICPACLKRLA